MNTSHRGPLLRVSLLVSLFLVSSFSAHSQDLDQAAVTGRISDTNGHPIRGATVSVEATDGVKTRSRTTDVSGRFKLDEISPGRYALHVHADGFTRVSTSPFSLAAGGSVVFDLTLEVAPVTATRTVEINADDVMRIDPARIAASSAIGARELFSIPNLKRDALQLLMYLGGVSEEALSVRDLADEESASFRTTPLEQGFAAVSGGAAYSNNVTIDGLDNNDDRTSRERFTPPIETVTEVQVIRNQFSAEYGRAAGSRINLLTARGDGTLRGSLSASMRHDRLNANSWRNNSRGTARPRMRQQRLSASLGGPLPVATRHGRLSFFGALETDRESDDTLIDTFVPAAPNSRFPLPVGSVGETFCESEEVFPCTEGALIRRHVLRLNTPNLGTSATGRVDHRSVRGIDTTVSVQLGLRHNSKSSASRVTKLKEAVQRRTSRTKAVNLSHSMPLGDRLFNQFRIQHSTLAPGFATSVPQAAVVLIGYRNPLTYSNETLSASNSTVGTLQNFSETRRESRLQLMDSATFSGDRHTVRTGFDIHAIRSKADSLEDASGTFSFPSFNAFHSNTLSRFRQNFGTSSEVRNRYIGLFVNEEFRVSDSLNASIGLRYETESAVSDRDNFGPRAGIAWDPSGVGRGVFRLGAGIFFNRVLLRTVADYRRRQNGDVASFDTNLIGVSSGDIRRIRILDAIAERFPSGFISADELRGIIAAADCAPLGTPSVPCRATTGFADLKTSSSFPDRSIERGISIPESLQVNAGYEAKVLGDFIVEFNATFNRTSRLWREVGVNLPVLPAGYADWTGYLLANPFIFRNANGTVRTYNFYLGDPVSGGGVGSSPGGTGSCPTTATTTCHVNLNSLGTSTTSPSTATRDTSNSVGSALGIAAAAIARFRPDPEAGNREMIVSRGRALYTGLVVELRSPFGRLPFGFRGTMRLSYTLSRTMDDGLNNTSNAETDSDFGREWARSLTDRRNRISFIGVFQAPKVLGGFEFAPGFRYGSSAPFNIGTGTDRNLDGSSTDRPAFDGDPRVIRWRHPSSTLGAELFSAFKLPAIGAKAGTLPRNAGRGPAMVMLDLSVSRRFDFGRKMRVSPRLEFGNVLNLSVFSFGAEYIDFSAIGPNPTAAQTAARQAFLVPSRTLRPREARGSLRVEF